MQKSDLESLNRKILNLSYMRELNSSLYSVEYNIVNELKFIDNFLYAFYVSNRNGLITQICSLMETHKKGDNEQLSLDRLIRPDDKVSNQLYSELKNSEDYKDKIKIFRDKFLSHIDYSYNRNESKKLEEIQLSDELIYSFTDMILDLGKKINISYNEGCTDYRIHNNAIHSLKELAEIFKISKDLDIFALRRMQINRDFESYNEVQMSINSLVEKLGY